MKLFIPLILFFSPLFIINENDIIVWQKNIQLTWEDFQGEPSSLKTSHIAMSDCGIRMEQSAYTLPKGRPVYMFYAFFVPGKSWYLKNKATENTLKHEQLHFDIAELYARKLRRTFANRYFTPKDAKTTFNSYFVKYEKMQQLYDKETKNGTLLREQKRWFKKVNQELNLLIEYP